MTALSQLFFIPIAQVLIGVALMVAGSGVYLVRHRFHRPEHHAEIEAQVLSGNSPAARAVGGRARAAGGPGR